jgi:hypothetical protein
MNAYLSSRGIEIVKNSKKTFFYSENINKWKNQKIKQIILK